MAARFLPAWLQACRCRTHACGKATPPGFEPGQREPKSLVLPLHYGVRAVAARGGCRCSERPKDSFVYPFGTAPNLSTCLPRRQAGNGMDGTGEVKDHRRSAQDAEG